MLINSKIQDLCLHTARLLGHKAPAPLLIFLDQYEGLTISAEARDDFVSRIELLIPKLIKSDTTNHGSIRNSLRKSLAVILTQSLPQLADGIDSYRRIARDGLVTMSNVAEKFDFEPEALLIALAHKKAGVRPNDAALAILETNIDRRFVAKGVEGRSESWQSKLPPKEGDDDVHTSQSESRLCKQLDLSKLGLSSEQLRKVSCVFENATSFSAADWNAVKLIAEQFEEVEHQKELKGRFESACSVIDDLGPEEDVTPKRLTRFFAKKHRAAKTHLKRTEGEVLPDEEKRKLVELVDAFRATGGVVKLEKRPCVMSLNKTASMKQHRFFVRSADVNQDGLWSNVKVPKLSFSLK